MWRRRNPYLDWDAKDVTDLAVRRGLVCQSQVAARHFRQDRHTGLTEDDKLLLAAIPLQPGQRSLSDPPTNGGPYNSSRFLPRF